MTANSSSGDYSQLTREELEDVLNQPSLAQDEKEKVRVILTERIREELFRAIGEDTKPKPPPPPNLHGRTLLEMINQLVMEIERLIGHIRKALLEEVNNRQRK